MRKRINPAVLKISAFALSAVLLSKILALFPEPIGSRAPLFVEGIQTTALLTAVSGALGLAIGIAIAALFGSKILALRAVSGFYLWIIQGTPLLVQVFFFYFVLPVVGISINEWGAGILALSFNVGAYHARSIRAGIEAVPKGQWEASKSLGLTPAVTFRLVILPQALKLMYQPLLGNLISLIKDSALVSSIGLLELSLVGSRISSETFQPAPVLITVALCYLWMTTGLLILSRGTRSAPSQSRSISWS